MARRERHETTRAPSPSTRRAFLRIAGVAAAVSWPLARGEARAAAQRPKSEPDERRQRLEAALRRYGPELGNGRA